MKMTRFHGILAAACMCLTTLGADEKKTAGTDDFDDLDWPQTYETSSGIEIALHQPQITYGALTLEADTTVDKEKQVVFLGDRTVKILVFPNAPIP